MNLSISVNYKRDPLIPSRQARLINHLSIMAPPTRAATKKKAQTSTGVSKKEAVKAAKEKRDQIQRQLKRVEEKYNKGDKGAKEELESQRTLLAEHDDIVQHMEEDTEPNEAESKEAESKEAESKEPEPQTNESHNIDSKGNESKTTKIKQEEEESLFVDGKTRTQDGGTKATSETESEESHESASESKSNKPLASTEQTFDNDDIGLVHAFGDLSLHKESGELETYFKGRFGQYYGVYRHGPKSAARYTIDYIAGKEELPEDLRNNTALNMDHDPMTKRKTNGRKTVRKGDVHRILGVAWEPIGVHGRMSSLAVSNWTQEEGGTRLHGPVMVVKVRWFHDKGPESWEKRGPVKDYMFKGGSGRKKALFSVPKTMKYDDITILEERTGVCKEDFLIIDTAVRLEERHREYTQGKLIGANRDPTPGLPLESEKKATTGSEDKAVAKL